MPVCTEVDVSIALDRHKAAVHIHPLAVAAKHIVAVVVIEIGIDRMGGIVNHQFAFGVLFLGNSRRFCIHKTEVIEQEHYVTTMIRVELPTQPQCSRYNIVEHNINVMF